MAERPGFEPGVPHGTTVFETAPFSHSGTSPRKAVISQKTTCSLRKNSKGLFMFLGVWRILDQRAYLLHFRLENEKAEQRDAHEQNKLLKGPTYEIIYQSVNGRQKRKREDQHTPSKQDLVGSHLPRAFRRLFVKGKSSFSHQINSRDLGRRHDNQYRKQDSQTAAGV
jgi:hypothetical protein